MATVEVSFTPLPAHVRTARLVATAVARRSGVPESLLDEVRLAVGEACSRAVEAHQRYCPAEPVHIRLTRDVDRFEVTVSDAAPADGPPSGGPSDGPSGGPSDEDSFGVSGGPSGGAGPPVPAKNGASLASSASPASLAAASAGELLADLSGGEPASDLQLPSGVSLAMIGELADDVHLVRTDAGLAIQMTWSCHADADSVIR